MALHTAWKTSQNQREGWWPGLIGKAYRDRSSPGLFTKSRPNGIALPEMIAYLHEHELFVHVPEQHKPLFRDETRVAHRGHRYLCSHGPPRGALQCLEVPRPQTDSPIGTRATSTTVLRILCRNARCSRRTRAERRSSPRCRASCAWLFRSLRQSSACGDRLSVRHLLRRDSVALAPLLQSHPQSRPRRPAHPLAAHRLEV